MNERQRQQRKKRRAIRNKPAYIPSQVSDTKSTTSDVDLMRLACLEHGGNNLDKYNWGFKDIFSKEKKRRQKNYTNWCRNRHGHQNTKKKLCIANIQQYNLDNHIQRTANMAVFEFTHRMRNATTLICNCCMEWVMVDSFQHNFKCSTCKSHKYTKNHFLKNNYQPIWIDENNQAQYHVPNELRGLSLHEELLIQKNAAYVPIIHVYNGSFGMKGHCIIFERESQGDINKLPRCESDTVCFYRQYGTKESGAEQKQMSLKVRRDIVMNALTLLKTIHRFYNNILIEEPEDKEVHDSVTITLQNTTQEHERNVSSSYCHEVNSTEIDYSSVDTRAPVVPADNKKVEFVKSLKECAEENNASVPILDFPATKKEPLR